MKKYLDQIFSLSFTHKCLVLSVLSNTLVGIAYTYIPFIFYRPKFYCNESICEEKLACQSHQLDIRPEFAIHSLSIEYELYCNNKVYEAKIITMMMFGRLFASLLCTYFSYMASCRRKSLRILISCHSACAFSLFVASCSSSLQMISFSLALWTFSSQSLYIFNFSIGVLYFSGKLREKVAQIQCSSRQIYSILLPLLFIIVPNWRYNLLLFTVPLHLGFALLLLLNYSSATNNGEVGKVSSLDEAPNNDLRVSLLKMLKGDSAKNFLILTWLTISSYIATLTSILYMNTLAGNIYINLTLSSITEFLLSLVGGFIAQYFQPKHALSKIFLMLGLLYLSYDYVSPFTRTLIVFQGELFIDTTWPLLAIYMHRLLPGKYISMAISTRSIVNLAIASLLPYTRHFLESLGFSLFTFIGLFQLCTWGLLKCTKQKMN